MEIFCPNCKKTADLVTIDEIDFINCPECGWFQTQADGSMTACDPPSSKVDRPPEPGQIEKPAALEMGHEPDPGSGPAATSAGDPDPPADKPDPDYDPDQDDESDDSGIEIEITFED